MRSQPNQFDIHCIAATLANDTMTHQPKAEQLKQWREWAHEVEQWCDGELANLQHVASLEKHDAA